MCPKYGLTPELPFELAFANAHGQDYCKLDGIKLESYKGLGRRPSGIHEDNNR